MKKKRRKKRVSKRKPRLKKQNELNQDTPRSVEKTNDQKRLSAAKQIFFTILIFSLFFAGLEFFLSLFGVKPLLLTEDPMVGFADNIPLFVKQQRDDGSIIYRSAKNKLQFFNDQSFSETK